MGQFRFRSMGGNSPNQLSSRQPQKSDRGRWRCVRRLAAVILSSSRVCAAFLPSTSRRKTHRPGCEGAATGRPRKRPRIHRSSRIELGRRLARSAAWHASVRGHRTRGRQSVVTTILNGRRVSVSGPPKMVDDPMLQDSDEPGAAHSGPSCEPLPIRVEPHEKRLLHQFGGEFRHTDAKAMHNAIKAIRRGNPSSFPVRFGVRKRPRGCLFRLQSVCDVHGSG